MLKQHKDKRTKYKRNRNIKEQKDKRTERQTKLKESIFTVLLDPPFDQVHLPYGQSLPSFRLSVLTPF